MFFVRLFTVLVLTTSTVARFKDRFFLPWLLPGPDYIIGDNGCPVNAFCLPGATSCQNDGSCPENWKCCKDFISRSCCMNLTGASVTTRSPLSSTILTPTTLKPENAGGGGGDGSKDEVVEAEKEPENINVPENLENEEIKPPVEAEEENAENVENPPPGENENV